MTREFAKIMLICRAHKLGLHDIVYFLEIDIKSAIQMILSKSDKCACCVVCNF